MNPWEQYASKDTSETPPWEKFKSDGVSNTPKQNIGAFVGGNLSKGVADVAGLPVDLAHSAVEGAKGVANLFGAGLKETEAPVGGSDWIKEQLSKIGAIGPSAEPRGRLQDIAAKTLEAAPSAVLPGGSAKVLPRVGAALGGGAGGEIGRQLGGSVGQIAGSVLGGGIGGAASMERAGIPKPPSQALQESKASGIPLTLGQETGSKSLTSVENRLRELFPSRGTAHADEVKQIEAGANRINQLADSISAPQGVPGELLQTNIGEKLRYAYQNTVKKIDKIRDTQAEADYGEVRKLAGDKPIVNYQNTLSTLDKIISENSNVPSADARKIAAQARSIKDALTVNKPGTPASSLVDISGRPLTARIEPTPQATTHTIEDAMKTRSAWGKAARRTGNIFSDVDPNVNQVLAKRLFSAINKDFDAASTEATPIARALKQANANYSKASQSLSFVEKSALGKLLGEDIADAAFTGVQGSSKAPEAIAKKYLSMTPSQAKSVTAILQLHSPEVLQDAKAFVLRNGLEAAKNSPSGRGPISFAKFRSEIDKVTPKLEQLGFSPQEIKDIKDVTNTMARAGDRTGTNPSGTAAAGHMIGTAGLALAHPLNPLAAIVSIVTPYVASKALLTEPGRQLLKQAYGATNRAARNAAIGALRAQYQQSNPQSQAGSTSSTLSAPPQ